jgi:sialate O-acetylesterase
MEMGVANVLNGAQEMAQANYPNIRMVEVPRSINYAPKAFSDCTWRVCSPEGISHGIWGGFSGAGYFFGRELNNRLKIPIGLIQSCWGGTVAEAWTSRDALMKIEDFRELIGNGVASAAPEPKAYERQFESWVQQNDPGSKPGFGLEAEKVDDTQWPASPMPARYDSLNLGDFEGVVWYRTSLFVDHDHAGKPAILNLGSISDCDRTWLNGRSIGSNFIWSDNRRYEVPAGVLKEGPNIIAVRCMDTGYWGGMNGDPGSQFLEFSTSDKIVLPPTWRRRATMDLRGRHGYPLGIFNEANNLSVLYNGMIAPLVPLAIKGAIWYQGESNVDRAYQYRTLLPRLIGDWRKQFGQGEFPFLIVQLANFLGRVNEPHDNHWAELREAQAMTTDRVRNTGLAVAIDIGMWNDIHPVNKQEVGRRLALSALNIAYHDKTVVTSGPRFSGFTKESGGLRIHFKNANGGLSFRGPTNQSFAMAGEDRTFYWAKAVIQGNDLVLTNSKVPYPVAARYAWASNPEAPLYNSEGLPAVPFRTDRWPGIAAPKP